MDLFKSGGTRFGWRFGIAGAVSVAMAGLFVPAHSATAGTFVNSPPEASIDTESVEEGTSKVFATVSDPDGTPVTVQWFITEIFGFDAGATCTLRDETSIPVRLECTDDGTVFMLLEASDGMTVTRARQIITVTNANPVGIITDPGSGISVTTGQSVKVAATVYDYGTNDQLTCVLAWGDGSPDTPADCSSGTLAASHVFTTAGTPTITLRVTDDDGGSGNRSQQITVESPTCIANSPTVGVVQRKATLEGNSGASKYVTFTIRICRSAKRDVKVAYSTSDGTAKAGSDYVAASGVVTFKPSGNRSITVTVFVKGDKDPEDDETFQLTTNVVSGPAQNLNGGSTAVGTIINDDVRT